MATAKADRFRKRPMTWRGAAIGSIVYLAIAAWLFATSRWPIVAWILLASAGILVIAAWDSWRKKK